MSKLLMLCVVIGVLSLKEVQGQSGSSPTAFGYQGRLTDGDWAADGLYDLRMTLYDAATQGTAVTESMTHGSTRVQIGLFTAAIDFGIVPVPGSHWLEIAVRRTGESVPFVPLLPRQPFLSVPQAGRATLATEALVARSIAPPTTPGAPSVALEPGADRTSPIPGGVAWRDPDGAFAGGIVADSRARVNFTLARPLHITGAPLIVSSGGGPRPSVGTNSFQVLGSAQFVGPLHADGGILFPDGSQLQSAAPFRLPNVLWVSTEGDDPSANRGDPSRPWRSIGMALSNAVSGDAVLILPGRYTVQTTPELGRVRVAAPIRLVSLTNVTVAGFGGTPEIYAPDFGDIVQVASCRNLTFRNLHFRSDASYLAEPPHGQSAGICFRPEEPANARILIDGCRFTGVPHAITTFAAPAVATDHLTVRDCTFRDCGWTTGVPTLGQDGGALTGFGNHMRFINNTLDGAIRGVEFYRFPGDPGHTNAIISGNIFLNYWDCAICSFDDGDENLASLDSVVITDNLFEDAPNEEPGGEISGSAAVLINSGRRITIRGNLVNRGKLYGIKVSALTGPLEYVDITANAVSDVVGRGIQVTDYGPGVQHVRITNNRVWGNYGGGLLAQGRFLDLSFNDITGNFPAGIRISESENGRMTSDSRVYGNSLIGNAAAIHADGLTNVLIEANHIVEPERSGTPTVASSLRLSTSQRALASKNPGEHRPFRRVDALRAWQDAKDQARKPIP